MTQYQRYKISTRDYGVLSYIPRSLLTNNHLMQLYTLVMTV